MKHLIVFLIFILQFSIFNCTNLPGTPGHISRHTSKFDNTRQLSMEPAWCDGTFKLSLFKNSAMPDSLLILTAVVKDIYTFAPGKSLEVRINRELFAFDNLDEATEHKIKEAIISGGAVLYPTTAWSSQRYIISVRLLEQMINGEEVWIKIHLDKEYLEGKFSTSGPMDARPAFKKFYAEIQKW